MITITSYLDPHVCTEHRYSSVLQFGCGVAALGLFRLGVEDSAAAGSGAAREGPR
jgi:hypothetical protein